MEGGADGDELRVRQVVCKGLAFGRRLLASVRYIAI